MFRASRQMVHGQLKLHVQRMLDRLHDTQRLNITVLNERNKWAFYQTHLRKSLACNFGFRLASCMYINFNFIFLRTIIIYLVYVKIHI